MNARNITVKDQILIDEFFTGLKTNNKDLSWNFFNQSEEKKDTDLEGKIKSLESKIDDLTNKINLIFDNHILINGQFEKYIF